MVDQLADISNMGDGGHVMALLIKTGATDPIPDVVCGIVERNTD